MPPDEAHRAQIRPLSEVAGMFRSGTERSAVRWPTAAWWKQFGSPELNRIVETALRDNPTLRAAADRLQQAQATADLRTAELLPLATSGIQVSEQHYSANSIQARYAGQSFGYVVLNPVQLQYHLDLWGKDRAALEEAMGQANAQTAELAQARVLLTAAIARVYAGFHAAIEQERIAAAWTDDLQQALNIEQRRHQSGLESGAEVHQADAAFENAQQRRRALAAEVRVHRDQLAVLAGHGPDWGSALTSDPMTTGTWHGLPANVPLHLVGHRPDIIAARYRAQAANKGIAAATKAFYPDVNIRGFAGLQSADMLDVLLNGSSKAFAIGPSLDLPIFQGGRLEAQLHLKQADYDAAVEHYNAAVVRAASQVADALTRWQDIEDRRTYQERVVADLDANQHLATALHDAGLRNASSPLLSRSALAEQRLRLKGLEAEQVRAIVDFHEALGGGYLFDQSFDE
jgi:NodT family efflux transporter outer membrane factor (OMF) lipoprotein